MDVHSAEVRSYNMSQIKGKNTKPELLVRKFLFSQGYRYRVHDKKLSGKPDIILRKHKTIIDVRGCFWHMHSKCKYGDAVKTPSDKITNRRISAVQRDEKNLKIWHEMGWRTIVVWAECELEPKRLHSEKRMETLNTLLRKLQDGDTDN